MLMAETWRMVVVGGPNVDGRDVGNGGCGWAKC